MTFSRSSTRLSWVLRPSSACLLTMDTKTSRLSAIARRKVSKLLSTCKNNYTQVWITYKFWELINTIVKRSKVGQDRIGKRIFKFFHLLQASCLCLLHHLVELGTVDWQMALDDLKSFVEIFLHRLVVDQVLLELLSELGSQDFQVFHLFSWLFCVLRNFFVNVAR